MGTKRIRDISREVTSPSGVDYANSYIESQDTDNIGGTYKMNLSVLKECMTDTYDTNLSTSVTVPSTVGGIPSGTTVSELTGKTFTELFDELLFPTVYPVLTGPSNTFTASISSLQEIGLSTSIQFIITFSRGSISPQYNALSPYRSGTILSPNGYNYTGSGVSSPISYPDQTISYTILQGVQTWSGSANYTAGVQPYDSKGNIYSSPLSAGTTSSVNVSIEGVYPLFGTTSDISNPNTKQTLVSMITGNNVVFNMVSESGLYKQSFDIPVAWTTSRPLSTVETYNSISSNWIDTGLSQWTTTSVSHTVQGNSISYTRYTYNGDSRADVNIRIVF